MATINDLHVCLNNMRTAKDINKAFLKINRSKLLAKKYANKFENVKKIISILDDAVKMVHHAPDVNKYINFISDECKKELNNIT